MIRRIVTALVLLAAALLFALWGNGWTFRIQNLLFTGGVAAIGFVFLHFRWHAQEQRDLKPNRLKDTFS